MQMSCPKVSVIIPAFNAEIIIIDDKSKDRTFELCKELYSGDERFVILQHTGLRSAHGEYAAFLGANSAYLNQYEFWKSKADTFGKDSVISVWD